MNSCAVGTVSRLNSHATRRKRFSDQNQQQFLKLRATEKLVLTASPCGQNLDETRTLRAKPPLWPMLMGLR